MSTVCLIVEHLYVHLTPLRTPRDPHAPCETHAAWHERIMYKGVRKAARKAMRKLFVKVFVKLFVKVAVELFVHVFAIQLFIYSSVSNDRYL